jgi:hypothetical protein
LEFPDYIYDGKMPLCPSCDEKERSYRSDPEIEIAEYLISIGVDDLVPNSWKFIGEELDIYSPKHRIAVEHGGLWWHSEYASRGRLSGTVKDRHYHVNKLKKCNAKNIRLITIFGDEWAKKKDICKARLAHIFGVAGKKIFARKTKVVIVPSKDAKIFLDKHHIQGRVSGSNIVCLGLEYEGDLVSVMMFGDPRTSMNQEKIGFELYRFASKYAITGGASKLFTAFVKMYDPEKVVSFCDLRWGVGRVYEQLGFVLDRVSDPGYYWVEKYVDRLHRSNHTKKSLIEQGFDPLKSETEIMRDRDFDRIWDCGNLRYVWKNS